jgi:hypothetical protein
MVLVADKRHHPLVRHSASAVSSTAAESDPMVPALSGA